MKSKASIRELLLARARAIRDARDIEIYDKHAVEYNALMEGVFRDQVPIELDDDD
jgi:hypothetical protein